MSIENAFLKSRLRRCVEDLNLQIMDIGARGGLDPDFLPAAWATSATGFEPEPTECERLNMRFGDKRWKSVRFVPAAIGGRNAADTLKLPRSSEGASLLFHNEAMIEKYGYRNLHKTEKEINIETATLDQALRKYNIPNPDYVKIDVEGAELDILVNGSGALGHCSAAKIEVSFLEQRLRQPLMHDVVAFMSRSGFLLGEISGISYWRRRPLPSHPYSAKWTIPYSKGVAAQCDLIFLRDPTTVEGDEHLLRLVLTSSILGFFDHGVGALRLSQSLERQLDDKLGCSFLQSIGAVSSRYGRAAAVCDIAKSLRRVPPLAKSFFLGVNQAKNLEPGY